MAPKKFRDTFGRWRDAFGRFTTPPRRKKHVRNSRVPVPRDKRRSGRSRGGQVFTDPQTGKRETRENLRYIREAQAAERASEGFEKQEFNNAQAEAEKLRLLVPRPKSWDATSGESPSFEGVKFFGVETKADPERETWLPDNRAVASAFRRWWEGRKNSPHRAGEWIRTYPGEAIITLGYMDAETGLQGTTSTTARASIVAAVYDTIALLSADSDRQGVSDSYSDHVYTEIHVNLFPPWRKKPRDRRKKLTRRRRKAKK